MMSCVVRQRPRREPKFHQIDRLIGAGRFIRLSLIENSRGCGGLRRLGIVWGREWAQWPCSS